MQAREDERRKGDMPQITSVKAALRLSKELPGGAWKTVELGAEAGLAEGESYETAMKALYEALAADMRKAFGGNGSKRGQDTGKPGDPSDSPGEQEE